MLVFALEKKRGDIMGSKPISHTDECSKAFIIKCLKGDKTHGFDIDAIHKLDSKYNNKYYVFEYLKDENERLSPHYSDPKYYPWNWRKFWSLYQITCELHGCLFLINYSDGYKTVVDEQSGEISHIALPSNYVDEVRVMNVDGFDIDKIQDYMSIPYQDRPSKLEYMTYSMDARMSFEEYSSYLRELNSHSVM